MEYMDEKGKVYEISYSQKLQREQNKLARQKNILVFCILIIALVFGVSGIYLYLRMDSIDLLTKVMVALSKCV